MQPSAVIHIHSNVAAAAVTNGVPLDGALFTRQPSTLCLRFVRPTPSWLCQLEKEDIQSTLQKYAACDYNMRHQ